MTARAGGVWGGGGCPHDARLFCRLLVPCAGPGDPEPTESGGFGPDTQRRSAGRGPRICAEPRRHIPPASSGGGGGGEREDVETVQNNCFRRQPAMPARGLDLPALSGAGRGRTVAGRGGLTLSQLNPTGAGHAWVRGCVGTAGAGPQQSPQRSLAVRKGVGGTTSGGTKRLVAGGGGLCAQPQQKKMW